MSTLRHDIKVSAMGRNIDTDDVQHRVKFVQLMAASCTGALLTSLFVTPLDVVKIRLQAQQKAVMSNRCFLYCNGLMDHLCPCLNGNGNGSSSLGSSTASSYWYRRPSHFNGTLDAFVKISRNEGISSLWSGLSPTLVLAVPATVIYFTLYDHLRITMKDYYNIKVQGRAVGEKHQQPMWIPMLSGSLARTGAVTLVSPLELVRTKMQSKRLSYFEMGIAVRSLVQQKGVIGLWRGLGPSLLRDVPFSALYWVMYENFKAMFHQPEPNIYFSFTAGAVSGTVAAVLTLPFDVVKTHRQIELGEMEIYTDLPRKSSSTSAIIKKIFLRSGIQGLFTGLVPRVIKVAPACAIMISSFEYGKYFFRRYNERKVAHS